MLKRLRQTAPAVALLICVALLATWMTGAHAHRHVGDHAHEAVAAALSAVDGAHESGHGHDAQHAHDDASNEFNTEHGESAHSEAHPVTLIHQDGHENVEVQALQPSPAKSHLDWPLLVLLCCAALLLTQTRTPLVAVLTDPPDPKSADWSLRPPLRGPPSFSVA
ncbi:MAG: hypothetical protein V4709_11695 [Pseudomonadota bacterium]|jgi:hypothetical protein